MDQIVECVPNFSEGRNQKTIDAIADAFRKHPNVHLIDVDAGYSTNRTVYTLCGAPKNVVDALIDAAKVAFQLIDMTKHNGEHKRLGSLDVCPFIPVRNLTMNDCVELAKETAKRLSDILKIPTYLYGYAATREERRAVPDIRKGEYEGLKDKLLDPEWMPDYGSNEFTHTVARFGATMVGARKFLIAYNINVMGTKEQATKIAFDIREQGRNGMPGLFKSVQAMGWTLEERNIAQITINLLDYEVTSIYQVWEEVNRRAREYCLPICGSEIVGVVPLNAILDVANAFIKLENILLLEEELKVNYVISKLGLNFLDKFNPKEKIIEYILEDKNKDENKDHLVNLTLKEFINKVSSRECVPGGGSVSALIGALGFSLATMVGRLSSGKRKFEHNDNLMRQILPEIYEKTQKLLKFVDLDSQAYSRIVEVSRLPERTDEECTFKQSALRFANLNAIDVPKRLINEVFVTMQTLEQLCPVINMNGRPIWKDKKIKCLKPFVLNLKACSDLQVAINCLKTAVHGAYYNVLINLESINYNPQLKDNIKREIDEKRDYVDAYAENLLLLIDSCKPKF